MNTLTKRQELFAIKYFELGNATQAMIAAGYAPKHAGNNSWNVLKSPLVQARIDELRQAIAQEHKEEIDQAIMNVEERQIRLSEIGRARITDFMELGQDGSWVNLGPETKLSGAIQEIHSRTEYDDDGSKPTVHTSVKLHDPMKAIDLLNKMDKIYSEVPPITIDSRQINIFVIDSETKGLISRVAERTLLNADAHHKSLQGNSEGVGREEEGDITGRRDV